MEPRINHRQPGWLGAWFQDRCHQGFDAPAANCLYLQMNYRFDRRLMLTSNYRRSLAIYDNALGDAVFHQLQPGAVLINSCASQRNGALSPHYKMAGLPRETCRDHLTERQPVLTPSIFRSRQSLAMSKLWGEVIVFNFDHS